MRMRCLAVLTASALLAGAALGAWAAPIGDLRPEWSVGQDQVSPALLAVTPPIPAPKSMTLQEAVDIALARNTGFRGTVSSLLSSRAGLDIARKRWNLSLSGSATQSQDSNLTTSAGAGLSYGLLSGADFSVSAELTQLGTEESQDASLSASLRQPLLAGFGPASASYEAVRAARNGYRSSLLGYFVSRQGLVLSIVGSYFSVVQQREAVTIQKESVSLAEQAVKDAQIRLDEGLIIEMELLNAQQRLASAQAAQVQAEETYQQSMDSLLMQLGLQIGGTPDLVSQVDYRPETQDLEAATQQALKSRPELYLAQLSIENSQAGVRLARSRRLPTLDLLGGLQRFTSNSPNLWNVGLTASVPVGAIDLEQSYRQSQWALLLAQQSLEDTRQQVVSDVRGQVRAAEAARRQVDLAEQGVKIAERSVLSAKRLVEESLRTNRDLLDAQNSLRDSRLQLNSSKINYFLAIMRLKVAMGADIAGALPQAAPPAAATPAALTTPAAPASPTPLTADPASPVPAPSGG